MDPVLIGVIASAAATAIGLTSFVLLKKKKIVSPEAPSAAVPAPQKNPYSKIKSLFTSDEFSQTEWEKFEETLLGADVGYTTAQKILEQMKQLEGSPQSLKERFRSVCEKMMVPAAEFSPTSKPYVISIIGVNGVGKTTTIGKLAHLFKQKNYSVLIGAVDTFRAAAISQLKVWADRTESQFVTGREGADPGAVAFDSVTAGKARGVDVVLLDTAGRLHTKTNLMDELKKIHQVVKKVIPDAPHQTWLVIDGTMGQNSIQQARQFKEALDLTGFIVTKMDGTAKGGALIAVSNELQLPILYMGLGEGIEDLIPFDRHQFTEAICS